jgi:hypothetical protein
VRRQSGRAKLSIVSAVKIELELSADERIALRRFANEEDVEISEAARMALRDWLLGHGYLESQADNDNG